MKINEMDIDDYKPIQLDIESELNDSNFKSFLSIIQRFNLIQQKNLQNFESISSEAIESLEKSRFLVNNFTQERTQLKEEISLYEKALIDILDVFDNMISTSVLSQDDKLIQFMSPGKKIMQRLMDKVGWSIIHTEGIVDSDLHYVIQTRPTEEQENRGLIASVIRPGYRCGDHIIRKAEVVVFQ